MFTRRILTVVAVGLLVTGTEGRRAVACGYSLPAIEDLTTFDPTVAAEPGGVGLYYDPFTEGLGGPCEDCARKAMQSDWDGYFEKLVPTAEWEQVLHTAPFTDLVQLEHSLVHSGKPTGTLAGIVTAVALKPALKKRVVNALAYVKVARSVGALATLEQLPDVATVANVRSMLAELNATALAQRDAFMLQRTAFLKLRVTFYQRDWAGVVRTVAATPELTQPSADLAWRARYYLAGALRRSGELAAANLELARIHAGWPALASVAAQDFQPMQDQDWQQSLTLATSVREQTLLWRLVGIKQDPFAAAQEIFRLDPTSELLGLLVVRELARIESLPEVTTTSVSADAQHTAYAKLEHVTQAIAGVPGGDRPWLFHLVSGHLAAKRSDLATTRRHIEFALNAKPDDPKVAGQARASLALALASAHQLQPKRLDELAKAVNPEGWVFGRQGPLKTEVRARLAATFRRRGRLVDAALLTAHVESSTGSGASKQRQAVFLKQLIARTSKNQTEFDRFLLSHSHSREHLETSLGLLYLLNDQFTLAKAQFAVMQRSSVLPAEPFVTHIVDCHDCDHDAYAGDWTLQSLAARLEFLRRQANGSGDVAALAAFDIGTSLYNLTWYGNARVILEGDGVASFDMQPAARWYQRAFSLARDRELKAQAAFFSAKMELATLLTKQYPPYVTADELPIPTTWYPVLQSYSDTQYYRQILAECGAFRRWAGRTSPR